MDGEATPIETSAETTETAVPNDGLAETALGGATAEAPADTTGDGTAQEAKGEDTESEAGDDAAPVVPEKYELTGTDGAELDAAAIELATPVFQELGLTNEQAQKLMPVAEQFAKSIGDSLNKQILDGVAAERAAWLAEAKADADIGGAKWDESMVTAAKALDQLGFPKGSPFRALLDDSGLGNHPEMIRAFVKVGRAIGEDTDFVRGDALPGPRTAAQILYGPKE